MVMYKVSVQFTVYIEGLLLSVKENQHKFYSLVLLGFSCDFISCYKLESQPLCTLGDSLKVFYIKKTGVSTKMIKNQNQSLIVLLVFTWEPKTKKLVYVMFSCFFMWAAASLL
jgi:hypothetical protein